ncbi:MAG: molybdopterin-dependent oxidoreductase [Nitrospinota bacterium]
MTCFKVNGREVCLDVDPDTPLIRALRDRLNLVGTKHACEEGLCGSCTVLVNGRPKTSCNLPARRVEACSITTIEGLGNAKRPHPLQRAFAETGAVQCGYCTPGMIMAAKALLDRKPDPTRQHAAHALRGHICRCTGYTKIADAVLLAARYMKGERAEMPAVAHRECLKKATGEATYTDDIRMPGLLHARILHSDVAHGEILKLDVAPARAQPGVRGVFTLDDVPGEKYVGRKLKDQPVFADGRIRYLGEPIALVVADIPQAAEKALNSIALEVKPLQAIESPQQALAAGAPLLHPKGNVCWTQNVRRGDTDDAFGKADAVVEDTYRTPFNEHLYMETDSGLAHWDDEGRLVLCIATQEIHDIRRLVAASLSLPHRRVRVIQTATGGAFGGRKICPFPVIVALAAYLLKAPVRLTYTRRETFLDSTKRHPFTLRYRLGADGKGNLLALEADITADTGAYASYGPPVLGRALAHAAGLYEVPNVSIRGRMVYTNHPIAGAMRGFGATQVHLAMECALDRLADALNLDPVELRRRNVLRPGSVTLTGERLGENVQAPAVLEAAARAVAQARQRTREANTPPESPWRRGVGMACHWFGLGTTKPCDFSEVRVSLDESGIVEVGAGVADLGQGSAATLWTIASERLGVPLEGIRLIHNDTSLTADSGPSNASRQTHFSGNALVDGLGKLLESLTPLAARLLEARPESVRFEKGEFFSVGEPEYRVGLDRLAAVACREGKHTVLGRFEVNTVPMDPETGEGRPYGAYISGAHVVEAEVNVRTGRVRLLRATSIHDIGKVVSPTRVEGQIEGSVAMGIGFAQVERFVPGKTESLKDYPVPRVRHIPEIRPILIEVPDASTQLGAKGIGESGLLSVAPAILNAVRDATGANLTTLPATGEEVRRAMKVSTAQGEVVLRGATA